jgi:hypothetical protein
MTKITEINQVPPEKGYYIAGFVDGEGSFYISARKRTDYPSGWRFETHFNVSNQDLAVLEICKKYFGCGQIRQSRPGFYTLEIEKRDTIRTFIIPFFKRFGFLSNKKKAEFRIFQQAFDLLEKGTKGWEEPRSFPISSSEDLQQLLALRQSLNQYRKTRITNKDDIILESFKFPCQATQSTQCGDTESNSCS